MNQNEFDQGSVAAKLFCRSIAQKVQVSNFKGEQYDGFTDGRSLIKKSYTEFYFRGMISGIYEYIVDKSLQAHVVAYFKELIDGVIAEYIYNNDNYRDECLTEKSTDVKTNVAREKYNELLSKFNALIKDRLVQNNNLVSDDNHENASVNPNEYDKVQVLYRNVLKEYKELQSKYDNLLRYRLVQNRNRSDVDIKDFNGQYINKYRVRQYSTMEPQKQTIPLEYEMLQINYKDAIKSKEDLKREYEKLLRGKEKEIHALKKELEGKLFDKDKTINSSMDLNKRPLIWTERMLRVDESD